MRVKVNFAFADELEYRSVFIDHPRATAEVVQTFLSLKYQLFGLKVEPTVRGGAVYLKIPAARAELKVKRALINTVARLCEHTCIRLSDPGECCDGCGKDHDLQDLAEAIMNPRCRDPYDAVAAKIPTLTPKMPPPVWTHRQQLGPPMVLN